MGFPGSAMRIAAAALSGLAYPLAFAPFDLFWLAPATVAVLFLQRFQRQRRLGRSGSSPYLLWLAFSCTAVASV